MATCVSATPNVGTFYGIKNSGLGSPVGFILTQKGYSMTAENFILLAQHIIGVKEKNEFPIKTKGVTDNTTEPEYYQYPDKTREVIEQGNYRLTFMSSVGPCLKKELMKLRGFGGGVFFMYSNNVILGTSDDSGVTIRGLTLSMLNVEKPKLPTSSEPTLLSIALDLEDETELSLRSFQAVMTWNVKSLDGLTPVTLVQDGAATATSVVVDVYSDCDGGCQLPVTGLVTADFAISGAGSITEVAESATIDGKYTLTTVGATSSTVISLVAPQSISLTTFPVIATVPATITVTP